MLRSVLCLSLFLASLTAVYGAEVKKKAGGKGAEVKIESQDTRDSVVPSGLAQSLGLSLPSSQTLAYRIGQARLACDPVALVLLAKELDAMEKVSGKKAALTAEALQKEAVDLASMRRIPEELCAVSELVKGCPASDELASQAKEAKEEEAKREKDGEETRAIRMLTVVNHTHFHVRVHVNGDHKGHVGPHESETFAVHSHHHHDHLEAFAHGPGGPHHWSQHVEGHHEHYTWHLPNN